MFDWLGKVASGAWQGVSGAVSGLVGTVVAALAGVLASIFHQVGSAWGFLVMGSADLENAAALYGAAVWGKLAQIVRYWLPRWAYTALWWVTHPGALAHELFWWVIKELESQAFTAARYLGAFALHLLHANLRRLLHTAEAILTAVL